MAHSTMRILLLEKDFDDVKDNKKFLAKQYFRIGANFCLCGNIKEGRDYLLKSIRTHPVDVAPLRFVLYLFCGEDVFSKFVKLHQIIKSFMNHIVKNGKSKSFDNYS